MDEKIDYDNKNEEFDKLVRVQQEVLNEKDQLIRQLQHELSISRNDYEAISNATFWKATKPLRIICDELKENKIIAALLNRNNFESENYKFKKITILTTKCTLFVAKLIKNSLERIGVKTTIITEKKQKYTGELHIVICPQEFNSMPVNYISFQMEQTVSSRWLTEECDRKLENSYAVLDYSLVNIEYFKKKKEYGNLFYYLPIDYLPGIKRKCKGYEYDVLFYGDDTNKRRKKILCELKKTFNVKIVSELYGKELYKELAKARIIINVHYYDNALLETTRLYEVLSLGNSMVVSERSTDSNEDERLENIVDFVDIDDIDSLKERIAYWLNNESERIDRIKRNTDYLSKRANSFDFFFYRFLLANDLITFDRFYKISERFIHFDGNRICLSLPEENERRKAFDADNKYGFQVFPGLRHKRGWTGCGLSYKFIMKKAKEQNMDNILVCEDDVYFPNDFEQRFEACMKYLENNKDWDIFQGLMADIGENTILKVDEKEAQTFVYLNHMISMVFNLYNENVYQYLIDWDERNCDVKTNTIDRALESHDLRIATTLPFLVGHKEDLQSTIWGFNNTQYNDLIKSSVIKLEELVDNFKNTNNMEQ